MEGEGMSEQNSGTQAETSKNIFSKLRSNLSSRFSRSDTEAKQRQLVDNNIEWLKQLKKEGKGISLAPDPNEFGPGIGMPGEPPESDYLKNEAANIAEAEAKAKKPFVDADTKQDFENITTENVKKKNVVDEDLEFMRNFRGKKPTEIDNSGPQEAIQADADNISKQRKTSRRGYTLEQIDTYALSLQKQDKYKDRNMGDLRRIASLILNNNARRAEYSKMGIPGEPVREPILGNRLGETQSQDDESQESINSIPLVSSSNEYDPNNIAQRSLVMRFPDRFSGRTKDADGRVWEVRANFADRAKDPFTTKLDVPDVSGANPDLKKKVTVQKEVFFFTVKGQEKVGYKYIQAKGEWFRADVKSEASADGLIKWTVGEYKPVTVEETENLSEMIKPAVDQVNELVLRTDQKTIKPAA